MEKNAERARPGAHARLEKLLDQRIAEIRAERAKGREGQRNALRKTYRLARKADEDELFRAVLARSIKRAGINFTSRARSIRPLIDFVFPDLPESTRSRHGAELQGAYDRRWPTSKLGKLVEEGYHLPGKEKKATGFSKLPELYESLDPVPLATTRVIKQTAKVRKEGHRRRRDGKW